MTSTQPRVWATAAVIALAAALGLTLLVVVHPVPTLDLRLRDALAPTRTHEVVEAARWLSVAGTWRVLVPVGAFLFVVSPRARRRWWLWMAVLVGGPLLGEAWQELIARPRPTGDALGFPSGHATAAATFATVVAYLASRSRLAAAWRGLVGASAGTLALAVGIARILLEAHWPTDVLLGFAIGIAAAATAGWWDLRRPRSPETRTWSCAGRR